MNAEPAPKTRKEGLAARTLQGLKRVEGWLAWFCLGVRPGSVAEGERQRNREEFLRATRELTGFCVLFTAAVVFLEALVVRFSADAGLPHPYGGAWLLALPVLGVWGLKAGQVAMNRRLRKIWRDVWR